MTRPAFRVAMFRAFFFAAAAFLFLPMTLVNAQSIIYSSELVDSTNWGYSHFGGMSAPDPSAGDTVTAQFDWDYSQYGIPEAPSSDAGDAVRRGLRLTANDTGLFPGDQIAVFYQDASFTGQYTFQVDVWANWASSGGVGVGSTEHVGVYAGFDPNDVNPFLAPAQNGAGILFDTDGDCGNCDYILTKDAAELDTFSGQYGETDFGFGNQPGYDNTDFNENIDIPMLFPAFDIGTATNNQNGSGEQPAGAAGYQWMTVTVAVDTDAIGNGTNGTPGLATFTLQSAQSGNSLTIGTVDNSVDDDINDGIITNEAPVGMGGGIALMMIDFFGGTPQPFDLGFMVFDNVRVYDGFLNEGVSGDFNNDGVWDCDDVNALTAAVAANSTDLAFDMNGDGAVTALDITEANVGWLAVGGANNAAATGGAAFLEGDANLDGTVDVSDFNIWNGNKFQSVAAWCAGDFNADGSVDVSDFNTWNGNKFQTSSGTAVVPEPSSLLLLLVSAGLWWSLRSRVSVGSRSSFAGARSLGRP